MQFDTLRRWPAWLIRPWTPSRRGGRRRTAALNVAILATTLALYASGLLDALEFSLMDRRFELVRGEASGGLVIVQIDGKSIQDAGRWPWPRDRYAGLLDRLFEAGVSEVALDLDFSSASAFEGDEQLAAALQRYGGRVILAAFHQNESPGASGELLDVRPLPTFAEQAAVAGVNIDVASDGAVRRYPIGQFDGKAFRPSMGALLAGNASLDFPFFLIDFGIHPASIPRLSVADIESGNFDPGLLSGRKVIVGATALELGDYVTVPLYRTLSGVTLQAMAYESLVQDRALRRSGPAVTLSGLLLLGLAAAAGALRWPWRRFMVTAVSVCVALLALSLILQMLWPLSLDVAPWLVLIALYGSLRSVREIELQAVQIFKQRMAGAYRRTVMTQVVEDSFDGIVITDELGRVELFNSAAARILDLRGDRITGQLLVRLQPAFGQFLDLDAAAAAPGELHQVVLQDTATGERILELLISQTSLQVSRHPRERRQRSRRVKILTFRDVTERVRALEAERAATEQAVLANRAKTEFLANMSHELRTPLNAVIGFSEMIAEEMLGPIQPPAYKGYARDINASGQHLLKMVDEVLDVAKIEAGRVELAEEVFPLAGLVNGCAGIIRGSLAIGRRQLVLRCPANLPYVKGDERLLKQILLNLLGNAVKFSPEEGRVTLSVELQKDGWAAILVSDRGIGIPKDKLEEVMKPFVQVEQAMSRRHEGAGLGLHIAATYAEMHGGRVDLQSEVGVGTTARLWLPPARLTSRPGVKPGPVTLILDSGSQETG